MASRLRELAFVKESMGRESSTFWQANCAGCHISSCRDCHGAGHQLTKPKDDACLRCHRDYFVGADYLGMAPREEHVRYQRGPVAHGQNYLPMRPDIHAEAGMRCSACHSMASLAAGKKSSRSCTDCHRPSTRPVEHRIPAHLQRMTCSACHAAWAPQEYGTFFLHFTSSSVKEQEFELRHNSKGWVKSVFLRRQDAPPLGVGSDGRVTPIRPQFLLYRTDVRNDRVQGEENRLLTASWKAFAPHTIRRGTAMCDGCHDNPRRFLHERPQERIYDLRRDGLGLDSFWSSDGQRMMNGTFMPEERLQLLMRRDPDYQRGYVEKWRAFTGRVAPSSSSAP
jgi:hypothetical protein